jgi:hypothetical protein
LFEDKGLERAVKSIAGVVVAVGLAAAIPALAQPGQHHGGATPDGGMGHVSGGPHVTGGPHISGGPHVSSGPHFSSGARFGATGFARSRGSVSHSQTFAYHGYRGAAHRFGHPHFASSGLTGRAGVSHTGIAGHRVGHVAGHMAGAAVAGRAFHSKFGGAPGFRPGGARPSYNPRFFPRSVNAGVRFHWRAGFWAGPPGWHYRRFFFGAFFPIVWCGPAWWINDYWWYELPVPPWGYAWVRNGPDALLINIRTGYIVEVVYGVFY